MNILWPDQGWEDDRDSTGEKMNGSPFLGGISFVSLPDYVTSINSKVQLKIGWKKLELKYYSSSIL